ncbi:hypothetical protein PN462_22490 [Spirulina sp. CS-785/01]|uniref:hypothetical protein n=1 Tax=Spirulina sp. CS-785/01 TaxID=3021716 RepID=UPI00232EB01F|nr:hypothetical protein [Spirulina sp. CS-785/01]MDB9315898.1 hypothetical protein [Spirulina sp. CS-785/01]
MTRGQHFWTKITSGLALSSILAWPFTGILPTLAQTQGAYCRLSQDAIARKEQLRQQAFQGNAQAKTQYQTLLQQHAQALQQCRSRNWPRQQAIWLRLYPCDAKPGALDKVLDDIVNKGYNEVYIEVFYDSQVLLPEADNPTPWPSVVRSPGAENVDLFADALQKARARGLRPYAWLFSMNFGYAYSARPDRQNVLARNGKGQTSIEYVPDGSQAFIDPYNRQAQLDYYSILREVIERRPDGVLFDYIRYPRGEGTDSVAANVQDLWIYGSASRAALLDRARNNQGRELINRFLNQGSISGADVQAVRRQYPNDGSPQWQGKGGGSLQQELWSLTLAHAAQGVINFLDQASSVVMRAGIPAGAVFFPGGNKPVGRQGFDSRLQPWDSFSPNLEWHPMSYALCGSPNCIVEEVERVINRANGNTRIVPALAGYWGRWDEDRPPLETQMQAIRRQASEINSVSHFAYSWQEPEIDHARRFCEL